MGLRFSIINISSFSFVFFFHLHLLSSNEKGTSRPSFVHPLLDHSRTSNAFKQSLYLRLGTRGDAAANNRRKTFLADSLGTPHRELFDFFILHAFYTPSVPDFLISFLSLHFSVVSSSLSLSFFTHYRIMINRLTMYVDISSFFFILFYLQYLTISFLLALYESYRRSFKENK